jgi:hypothetical protein
MGAGRNTLKHISVNSGATAPRALASALARMTEVLTSRLPPSLQLFSRRRDGGREQRFCCAPCRAAFYAACRTWAAQAVFDGTLSVGAIRDAAPATCILVRGLKSPSDVGK